MSSPLSARYEPQIGLAPAAPTLPLAPAAPRLARDDSNHADVDEAASLLPRPAVHRVEPAQTEVSRLRRGFYAYSVASEVFVIVAGTLFLPVVLETYARENGRVAPDFVARCLPSGLGRGGGDGGEGAADGDQARCAVRVLGMWVDTASVALLTYSASVAAQAFTVISIGRLADDPHIRHRLLSLFALVGSAACILFLAVPSDSRLWPLSALLALVANVSFGASIVALNSYLPDLGRLDPAVLLARGALDAAQHSFLSRRPDPTSTSPHDDDDNDDDDDDDDALLGASESLARATDAYTAARGRATAALSARAIAAGYAAVIAVLLALLPVVQALSASASVSEGARAAEGGGGGTWPLRVAVAVSGAWWLVGSVPAAAWLRPLEGDGERQVGASAAAAAARRATGGRGVGAHSWVAAIRSGWSGLAAMLREWKRLPQAFRFLAAWFLLSDAFATITSTAVLFAKTSLGLPTSSLIYIAILTPLSGLVGALACPLLQSHLHLSTHHLLVAIVILSLAVPLWGVVALHSARQMYLLAVVFGLLFGAFQAFARALYAQLIPPARASAFYALYSITDKSSSFLGPMLVAVVTTATGEIRHGFVLIAALMAAAVPILVRVDVGEGAQDAERMDRELKDEAGGLDVDDDDEEQEGLGGRA